MRRCTPSGNWTRLTLLSNSSSVLSNSGFGVQPCHNRTGLHRCGCLVNSLGVAALP